MKKFLGICLVLMSSIGVYGGDFEKDLETFDKISVTGEFRVHLKEGNEEKISVVNQDEDLKDENIIITVKEGLLKIYIKADLYIDDYDLDVYVTYKKITDIKAKMSCDVDVESTLKEDYLKLSGETSGKIKATIVNKELKVVAGSGCTIDLEGKTKKAVLKSNLGGTVAAIDLEIDEIEAVVIAGGDVICHAVNKLAIDISSGGTVTYKGSPEEYEQSIFLGGKIKKLGDIKVEPANE